MQTAYTPSMLRIQHSQIFRRSLLGIAISLLCQPVLAQEIVKYPDPTGLTEAELALYKKFYNDSVIATGAGTSTARGQDAFASHYSGTAYGNNARATGYNSIAIGTRTPNNKLEAGGNFSAAIGTGASSFSRNAFAFGTLAGIDKNSESGIAIGTNAKLTNAYGAIAIGARSTSSVVGSVTLGADSVGKKNNNTTKNITLSDRGPVTLSYDNAGIKRSGAVSVGGSATWDKRQIKGVADGSLVSDVATVGQLSRVAGSINRGFDKLGNELAASLGGDSSYNKETGTFVGPSLYVDGKKMASISSAIIENNKQINLLSQQLDNKSPASKVQLEDIATALGGGAIIDASSGRLSAPSYKIQGATSNNVGDAFKSVDSNLSTFKQALVGLNNSNQNLQGIAETLGGGATVDPETGLLTAPTYNSQNEKFNNISQAFENVDAHINGLNQRTNTLSEVTKSSIFYDATSSKTAEQHQQDGDTPAIATASGLASVAAGSGALASAANSSAIGYNTRALKENDVALGAGSVAERGAESYFSQLTGQDARSIGTVSVGTVGGERIISNVADGRYGTDAANVRQVEAVLGKAFAYTDSSNQSAFKESLAGLNYSQNLQSIAETLGGDATIDPETGLLTAPTYNSQNEKFNNISQAFENIDAHISGLNQRTNTLSEVTKSSIFYDATSGKTAEQHQQDGDAPAIATASGLASITAGSGALASAANSSAIGNNTRALKENDVALGAGSVAERGAESYFSQLTGQDARSIGTISVGTVGGERIISNVADGRYGTDAANVRQVEASLNKAIAYTDSSNQSALKESLVGLKYNQNLQGIAEILGGGATLDPETGLLTAPTYNSQNEQFNDVFQTFENVDAYISALNQRTNTLSEVTKSSILYDATSGKTAEQHKQDGDAPAIATASGLASIAAGSGALASATNSSAIGYNTRALKENDVALGAGSVAERGAEFYFSQLTGQDARSIGTISVGTVGGERIISNVADGRYGTDAANVRQVEAALGKAIAYTDSSNQSAFKEALAGIKHNQNLQGIAEIMGGGATVDSETGLLTAPTYNSQNEQFNDIFQTFENVDAYISALNQRTNTLSEVTKSSIFYDASSGKTAEQHLQDGDAPAIATASGMGSMAAGSGALASANNSSAFGYNARALRENDVALGAGAVAERGAESYFSQLTGQDARSIGTVSVGTVGGERIISNVADGRYGTDAANVRQVEAALGKAMAYTDIRIAEPTDQENRVTPDVKDKEDENVMNRQIVSEISETSETNETSEIRNAVSSGGDSSGGGSLTNSTLNSYASAQQLDDGLAEVRSYTDSQISRVDKRLSAGIAGVAALANMPQAYRPGSSLVTAAFGAYRGQQALSLGLSGISDNGKFLYKAGVAIGSSGNTVVGGGVGFRFR